MDFKKIFTSKTGVAIVFVAITVLAVLGFSIICKRGGSYMFKDSRGEVKEDFQNGEKVFDLSEEDNADVFINVRFFEDSEKTKNVYAISDSGKFVNLGAIGRFKLLEKDSILYYFTLDKELHKVDYRDINNITDVGTGIIIEDYSNATNDVYDWGIYNDYIYILKSDKYITINLNTMEKNVMELSSSLSTGIKSHHYSNLFFDFYSQKLLYTEGNPYSPLGYIYNFSDSSLNLFDGFEFSSSSYNNIIMLSRSNAKTCLFSRRSLQEKFCINNKDVNPKTVTDYGVFPLNARIYKNSIIVESDKGFVMYSSDGQNVINFPTFNEDYVILNFSVIGDKLLLKIGFDEYCYEGCSYNYKYYLLSLDGSIEDLSELSDINLYAVDNED